MQDKNRIRPFCQALAELWEQKPELRFGQIVSLLPRYTKEAGGDLFYLEDDESLGAMRRLFDGKRKKVENVEEEKTQELETQWQELMEQLQENEFDLQSFQVLFANTWKFLVDSAVQFHGINPRNMPILSCISAFCWHSAYPDDTASWEFDACNRFAEALIHGIGNPLNGGYRGNFYEGYLIVSEYHGAEREVHISEFDACFAALVSRYREDAGEDDE